MKPYNCKDVLNAALIAFERHFIGMLEKPKSTVGFKKYPSLRDHPLHSAEMWLEGKRIDDNLGGLWRIHSSLYDFSDFINKHPGGDDWLNLTKGTDITEAFESHHISLFPEEMLSKYLVRETKEPRNSPFTFHEDGLYRTLKRNVREELRVAPESLRTKSKLIADALLLTFIITSLGTVLKESYVLGVLAGIFLMATCIASHNFFHQRNNFRMYYFDLTMMSSRSWRTSHSLSHHMYTNTVYDLEVSALEPYFQYLTMKKSLFVRYASWIYTPIVYGSLYFGYFLRTIVQSVVDKKSLRPETYLPFVLLLLLAAITGKSVLVSAKFLFWTELVGSFAFGIVGLNAGHHHPDVFHDGDDIDSKDGIDWGLYQVRAAMDRTETRGSHFWSLISFGDHVLHHLFPAVDHGTLLHLYPTIEATLEGFGLELAKESTFEVVRGQFLQLSKTEPKK